MRLLVLGASGGCGRCLVRLAADRGHDVTAIVRPGTRFEAPGDVRVRRMEILEGEGLGEAVCGHDGVASCLGLRRKHPLNPWSRVVSPCDLTSEVARSLVSMLSGAGVRGSRPRLIAISAAGVAESEASLAAPVRWLIRRSNIGISYADLGRMESILGGSDIDWMVVRPVTLVNRASASDRSCVVDRYGLMDRISRIDVAQWMIRALESSDPPGSRKQMIGWKRGR